MIRFAIAFLMLCSVACGQVKVEIRQLLTGVDKFEQVGNQVFVSQDSKPVVQTVGLLDLGKIPEKPQSLKVFVTDAQRRPLVVERLTPSQYIIRGEGRVWIDARVTDLPSLFLLDETIELELPASLPTPTPQPIPSDETERIVSNALIELRKGYSQAFRQAGDAIKRGEIKVDSKLQSYLLPLTTQARTNAMAGVDGLLQDKLPRDGVNLRPEAASFVDLIGQAFGKGLK